MADGDRSTDFRHSVRCAHDRLLGHPCAECQRCEHGVSALGGLPCPVCEPGRWVNGIPREVRRDLLLGDDEPGLDLWREYAAAFLHSANVRSEEDDVGCDGPYGGERVEMARAR